VQLAGLTAGCSLPNLSRTSGVRMTWICCSSCLGSRCRWCSVQ
jgi:hypothetical protein